MDSQKLADSFAPVQQATPQQEPGQMTPPVLGNVVVLPSEVGETGTETPFSTNAGNGGATSTRTSIAPGSASSGRNAEQRPSATPGKPREAVKPGKNKRGLQVTPAFESKKKTKKNCWDYQSLEDFLKPGDMVFQPGDLVKLPVEGMNVSFPVYACLAQQVVAWSNEEEDGNWLIMPANLLRPVHQQDLLKVTSEKTLEATVFFLHQVVHTDDKDINGQATRNALVSIANLDPTAQSTILARTIAQEWYEEDWTTLEARNEVRDRFRECFDGHGLTTPADAWSSTGEDDDDHSNNWALDAPVVDDEEPRSCLPENLRENINEFESFTEPVRRAYDCLERLNLIVKMRFPLLQVLDRVDILMDEVIAEKSQNSTKKKQLKRRLRKLIGGGKTQSGKTALKMALAVLAYFKGFAVVIVSTTESNCGQLVNTFKKDLYSKDTDLPFTFKLNNSVAESGDKFGKQTLKKRVEEAFSLSVNKPAFIVAAYSSFSQLEKIADRLRAVVADDRRPVLLLLDEADDMLKHEENDPKCNQQERYLRALQNEVALAVSITATPIPPFIDALNDHSSEQPAAEDIFLLKASDDYVATADFKPLKDENGKDIFLAPKELVPTNKFTSDKVLKMVQDAAKGPHPNKALIVDITNRLVNNDKGIYAKGGAILDQVEEDMVALTVTGGNVIHYRAVDPSTVGPDGKRGYGPWQRFDKTWMNPRTGQVENFSLGDAIQYVEKKLKFEGPILVLGYTMLFRGVSVRSSTRVPTHLIVNLTDGLSVEKLVQAFGRGTGDFNRQLRKNGYDHVKVLCQESDLALVRNYTALVEELQESLTATGLSFDQAMSQALEQRNLVSQPRIIGHAKRQYVFKLLERFPHLLPIPEHINFQALPRPNLLNYAKDYKVRVDKSWSIEDIREALNAARDERAAASLNQRQAPVAVGNMEEDDEVEEVSNSSSSSKDDNDDDANINCIGVTRDDAA